MPPLRFQSGPAVARLVDGPPVRPDRPRGCAGLLTLTGVHRLEVVDVAIGLVEVAVLVVVEAVPLVERRQVRLDVGVGLALRLLLGVPSVGAVLDEPPHVGGVLGLAVARLVVGHLHPVGGVALDRVASARHLAVEARHRLAGTEEHVLEVVAVEVVDPVRGVVGRAVGLRDVVVHGPGRCGRVARVLLVAEVDEERQDVVGRLQPVLRPLARGDLDGLAPALGDRRRFSAYDLGDGLLDAGPTFGVLRVGSVVDALCRASVGVGRRAGDRVRRRTGRDAWAQGHGGGESRDDHDSGSDVSHIAPPSRDAGPVLMRTCRRHPAR